MKETVAYTEYLLRRSNERERKRLQRARKKEAALVQEREDQAIAATIARAEVKKTA